MMCPAVDGWRPNALLTAPFELSHRQSCHVQSSCKTSCSTQNSMVGELSSIVGMSKELLLGSLGPSRATISRKEKDQTVLSKDESERS